MPNLKFITIGAENLLVHQKQLIENVFKVAVRQHYGLAEAVANISESPFGELIIDNDFCYLEFIPIDEYSDSYKIIGTNITNTAFPLIRYDTNDIATIQRQPDGSTKILSIDGRKEDYIELVDGSRIGRLDHIFKDLIYVKEAQILQGKRQNDKVFYC